MNLDEFKCMGDEGRVYVYFTEVGFSEIKI